MKPFVWRGPHPNFGDEINDWLWPKLIPDLLDEDASVHFLGIGSILFNNIDPGAFKIVFGAGYGGYTPLPRLDERWFVYFVRGPRTASLLGLDPRLGLGDAGTLIRAVMPAPVEKRYRASFIPHWEGLTYGAWQESTAQAGLNLIDPRWPVDTVLDHILASRMVVCEAMHGAIIADALRVPWVGARPLMRMHQAKWDDWADSLGLTLRMAVLRPSSWLEQARQHRESNRRHLRWVSDHGLKLRGRMNGFWCRDASRALTVAAQSEPQLSSDVAIERATAAMLEKLRELRAGRHISDSVRTSHFGFQAQTREVWKTSYPYAV
jgi:succinoglycan biosynthesis protein ExoV